MKNVQTSTEVANLALGVIGAYRITNLETDDQDYARTLRDNYGTAVRFVQSTYPWPELYKEMTLDSPSTIPTVDGGYYRFPLPADILTIRDIPGHVYVREGKDVTVAGISTAAWPIMEYTAENNNPDQWSTYLLECTYTRLAVQIAMSVAESDAVYAMAENRHIQALMNANKAKSGGGSFVARPSNHTWNGVRTGCGSSGKPRRRI